MRHILVVSILAGNILSLVLVSLLAGAPAPKPDAKGPIKKVTETLVWEDSAAKDLVLVVEAAKTVTITGDGYAAGWRCQEPPPASSTGKFYITPNNGTIFQ